MDIVFLPAGRMTSHVYMMTIGTHRKAINEYPIDTDESACPVTAGDVMDDGKSRKEE
jgi:hypothetical protein